MKTIRWGILGAGKIAHKFAGDLRLVADSQLVAIASRDADKAHAFAAAFEIPQVFTSYTAMLESPDVDVVYVATPHGLHHAHVMLCLQHRKAVLCEKAFALNRRQAEEMIGLARQQGVFLMEAFWTRFLPQFQQVQDMIQQDTIGEVRLVQADFGFHPDVPVPQRLYDPKLGGGALLDIGIYPVFLAQTLLGKPTAIQALMTPFSTGVDEQCVIIMQFASGAVASLTCTLSAFTPVEAMIAGTRGRIHLRNRFHNAVSEIELAIGKEKPTPIASPRETGYGYQFEARHVVTCLQQGLTESPLWSHAHTLDLLDTLDAIRAACGITYAVDE